MPLFKNRTSLFTLRIAVFLWTILVLPAGAAARRQGNLPGMDAPKAQATFSADARQCDEHIAYSRKALELSHDSPDAQLALARSLRLCQNYTEAADYYQKYLESYPQAQDALYELGDTFRLARRFPEASRVFQELIQLNQNNLDGQVGLAQVLAATGDYDEALTHFNQILAQRPDYYDAIQGKAYALFWKNDFEPARALFESLAQRNPSDPQNTQALKDIAKVEEQTKWKALRPAANASPQAWLDFYRKRLASDPKDRDAMKGLAYAESELNNRSTAIQDYRQVLQAYPDDRDSTLELARLLSLDRQYPASIQLYQKALQQNPNDARMPAELAHVYVWAGQPQKALKIYRQLLARDESNQEYQLEVARLDTRVKYYAGARAILGSLLLADPKNRDAQLELARVDLAQARLNSAQDRYQALLKDNPHDPDALLGTARIDFYQRKFDEAQAAAAQAVQQRPGDFSSIFLLASIEHARHHRRETLNLLNRADQLSPDDPEVASLRKSVLSESAVTLTTTAAYTREIGPASQFDGQTGYANEDLRMYTYGATVGLNLLPRTNSYISYTMMPTDSPAGPERDSLGNQLPTGVTGAAVPSEFLYRQSTEISHRVTLRGGVGFVRFGPGDLVSVPGQNGNITIRAADQKVIGQAGLSFALTKKIRLDFNASRSGVTYTPTSTRFGVIEDQLKGRINYFFNSRTELHADYWYGRYSSEPYAHVFIVNGNPQTMTKADHDNSDGVSVDFKRTLFHSDSLSIDAGYEGVGYEFAGNGNVFLGFFNPSFYQRHELVPRIYGTLWGPFGYDLSSGIGIQQVGRGAAITRAWRVTPELSLRVSRHLRLVAGYTHYNTAEILGPLRGNAVWFTTEWRY